MNENKFTIFFAVWEIPTRQVVECGGKLLFYVPILASGFNKGLLKTNL